MPTVHESTTDPDPLYRDYNGLKKRINAIQEERNEKKSRGSNSLKSAGSPAQVFTATPHIHQIQSRPATLAVPTPQTSPNFPKESPLLASSSHQQYGSSGQTPPLQGRHRKSPSIHMVLPPPHEMAEPLELPPPAKSFIDHGSASIEVHPGDGEQAISSSVYPAMQRPRIFSKLSFRRSRTTISEPPKIEYDSYGSLIAGITPTERRFFEYLDTQVDKVESFFDDKYKEAAVRLGELREQFHELREHRRAYNNSSLAKSWKWKTLPQLPKLTAKAFEAAYSSVSRRKRLAQDSVVPTPIPPSTPLPFHRDPETYHTAKKELKHAVSEFYRFLELLKDFQALNVTAIRKSLKKFEKSTGMVVHVIYNRERVESLRISSDKQIKTMIEDVERLYAARFEGGEVKKARDRLRTYYSRSTHHFNSFRSGMMIGLGIPALTTGIYQAFQPETQQRMPIWWAILEVYATFFVPVMFSFLVGVNIIAWAKWRLNFAFIFELDLKTAIDYREYFELPTYFFMTLSYALLLSFAGIFDSWIAPTSWPALWLLLFVVTMLNPFRPLHLSSRYWLLRNWGKLFAPGIYPVDFADFWMGDQLCSMVYTIGRLYFTACVYAVHWDDPNTRCNLQYRWIPGIILSAIPSLIRLIQCVKRYSDSKNYIHLVNAGKYASSIVASSLFFSWREHGANRDQHYIAWILFSVVASLYTSAWDLLMDWSLLQPQSPHPLLRPELIYGDHYPVYYVAMILNVLIRFNWIIYAPKGSFNFQIRALVVAISEMLRRIQWNFFRVENEHLGNADQYRVTREVPLPYTFDNAEPQDDSDDDAENDKREDLSQETSGVRQPEAFTERSPDTLRSMRLSPITNLNMTDVESMPVSR
ncbi:hypothetical protein FRB99_003916 [Tulasnella sp. 403]|nr:hypothetical protein FRB99_003916 [Tulasnella sp. 403]